MRNFRVLFNVVFCLSLVGLLALSFGITSTSGQIVSWATPVALSSAGSFSWFPDVIADRSGQVHVAWSSGVPGYDAVLYTNSINGESWGPINDVAALPQYNFGSAATRPSMAIDQQGYLHMTFVDTTKLYYSKVPVYNAALASAWTPKRVLSGDQTAYFSKLAVDQDGTIHLLYTENFPTVACLVCYHLYYRQSTDSGNSWTKPVEVSPEQEGVVKPQLLIDADGNLHAVWEAGLGGGLGQLTDPTTVKYSASYDDGVTWSAPAVFSVIDNPNLKNITIGVDKNKQLVIVFWALPYDWIMYTTSKDAGRTWTEPEQITNVWGAASVYKSNLDTYSIAADSAGNLHLVLVGTREVAAKTVDVLDLVWDGEEWAEPVLIAEYEKDVPEWPRVAVSRGNQVNVVWFVRDEAHIWDSAAGRYRVWYAKGISSASPVAGEPIPTFTPVVPPTEEVAVSTLPAVTPTPTEPSYELNPTLRSAESKPPEGLLYSEQDYLALIGKAILPALLFLGGAIAIAIIRKR